MIEEIGSTFLIYEEIIVILLIIASVVAIVAGRLRLPYTVGLVLIGLALTFIPRIELEQLPVDLGRLPLDINLPGIILTLLVPPLIFEAAFHIKLDDLRVDFGFILLLAVPGVILSTFLVGGIINLGTGIAFPAAMVFGSLIAATDPVAVVALFRRLGVPKRLQVLLEGESLFNDGTAIVMYGLMVEIAKTTTGAFDLTSVDVLGTVTRFLMVAGGGVLLGVALGFIVSQVIGRIDDSLVETTLTTILAFGSYIAAELLGVSGVLAVVAAGLINGNVGPRGMSPTTRVVVFNFWEFAAFIANSLIFLFIGLAIDIDLILSNLIAIGWAILAVILARAVGIYTFSILGRNISWKWRHVLQWGGLRGAIALALVLSLSEDFPWRESLEAMAFGVVLFTLLAQGLSMGWLTRRLKLVQRSHFQEEYERRHARFIAARSSFDYLRRMSQQGLISEHTWQRLSPLLDRQTETLADAVRDAIASDPTVEIEELDTARREVLRAQRSALTGLLRDGVIAEDVYSQLIGEVDTALAEQQLDWPELLRSGSIPPQEVERMMIAVIQEQDIENAVNALSKLGFSVARMPSTGGFLKRRNVVILIGMNAGREETAVKVLQSSCRRRVEFASNALQNIPIPLPAATRVNVGGATVFVFEVETYDEF